MYYLAAQFAGCLCLCIVIAAITLKRVRRAPLSVTEILLLVSAFVLAVVPALIYIF